MWDSRSLAGPDDRFKHIRAASLARRCGTTGRPEPVSSRNELGQPLASRRVQCHRHARRRSAGSEQGFRRRRRTGYGREWTAASAALHKADATVSTSDAALAVGNGSHRRPATASPTVSYAGVREVVEVGVGHVGICRESGTSLLRLSTPVNSNVVSTDGPHTETLYVVGLRDSMSRGFLKHGEERRSAGWQMHGGGER